MWFTDHALHGDVEQQSDPTHTVSYVGVLQQALRDLSAWVEKGINPPPSTKYRVVDGQVEVPSTAVERRGVQPVVNVTANGDCRAEVNAGHPVTLSGIIELPSDTGTIIAAQWDFEGIGDFSEAHDLNSSDPPGTRARVTASHIYAKAGTYFVTLRAVSQREGDAHTPYGRIQNLGRVRVVVK